MFLNRVISSIVYCTGTIYLFNLKDDFNHKNICCLLTFIILSGCIWLYVCIVERGQSILIKNIKTPVTV